MIVLDARSVLFIKNITGALFQLLSVAVGQQAVAREHRRFLEHDCNCFWLIIVIYIYTF